MFSTYRFIIRGHLEPDWSAWFGKAEIQYDESDNTVVICKVQDQSALHGILARIRDLNLTLISVNQCED